MAAISTKHIEITPGICGGGKPVGPSDLGPGHRRLARADEGMSPDEIAATYPSITLADVHAALAYYHDHRDEIRGDHPSR